MLSEVLIQTRVPAKDAAKLKTAAQRMAMSQAAFLRLLIREAVNGERYGSVWARLIALEGRVNALEKGKR